MALDKHSSVLGHKQIGQTQFPSSAVSGEGRSLRIFRSQTFEDVQVDTANGKGEVQPSHYRVDTIHLF